MSMPGDALAPDARPGGTLDLERARRLAVDTAEAAGRLLRAGLRRPLEIQVKNPTGDVVTQLDLAAEALIVTALRDAYPGHRIIAEEAGLCGGTDADHVWLVDPLDGTNNIAIGMPVYAVGLALCISSVPAVGVVHDPVGGRTWSAIRGRGIRGPDGSASPVEPSGSTDPARPGGRPPHRPLVAWVQGHRVDRRDPRAAGLKAALEPHCRRMLQLWAPLVGWSMLARGDIDGVVGYRAELVDLPAGLLIAQEAGVQVRRLNGAPYELRIDRPARDRSFVAARPALLPELLDLIGTAEDGC